MPCSNKFSDGYLLTVRESKLDLLKTGQSTENSDVVTSNAMLGGALRKNTIILQF